MIRIIAAILFLACSLWADTKNSTGTYVTTYHGSGGPTWYDITTAANLGWPYGPMLNYYSGSYDVGQAAFSFDTNIGASAVISSATITYNASVYGDADNLTLCGQWGLNAFNMYPSCTAFSGMDATLPSGAITVSLTNPGAYINKTGTTTIGVFYNSQGASGSNYHWYPSASILITYTIPGKPRLIVITDSD